MTALQSIGSMPGVSMTFSKSTLLLLLLSFGSPCSAADLASRLEFFEKRIRPLLADNCYQCHSVRAQSPKAGLLLDSRARMLAGGDSGPAIVPGEPNQSRLVQAVEYVELQMPPRKKLAAAEIDAVRRWIADGAVWPEEPEPQSDGPVTARFDWEQRAANHWCWQPINAISPPQVADREWVRNPIDQFVLSRLESVGLMPAEDADRYALIRRLSFDLIGLPPTDEEVRRFVNDDTPNATERLVDRLLASPHFGEKWARHWMDLVRYAETCGHEFDYPLPHAWKYRDYLIRAFNADVPYDEFIAEHIAGDLLANPRRHPDRNTNESILGTGFWFLGEAVHGPTDVRGDEADRIDNAIDVFGKTFLGLTIACARCHDHKFDPISAADYYALAGFLQSSRRQEALLDPHAKIAAASARLAELRDQGRPHFQQLAQAGPGGEQLAKYLLKELSGTVTELPKHAEDTDAAQKQDAEDFNHPLHLWFRLRNVPEHEFAESVKQLSEQHATAETAWNEFIAGSKLLFDFRDGWDGWSRSGTAFGENENPVESADWDVSARPLGVECPATVSSGLLGKNQQGVLRSPTFSLDQAHVHYFLRARKSRIRLIIDGFVMDTYNPLLFQDATLEEVDTKGRWQWQTQFRDLHLHLGHRAHIELIDHGDGAFAVQQIRTSDSADVPPHPSWIVGRVLQQMPSTRAELAAAFGVAWEETLEVWRQGSLDGDQANWINWAFQQQFLSIPKEVAWEAICAEAHQLDDQTPSPERALAMIDGTAEDEAVHIRGSHKNLGDVVPRRFLLAISGTEQSPLSEGSGRLELARRVTSDGDALTARVAVNRLWHHLMGRGLVPSVDDFGVMGQPPTHPELLDWLAQDFLDGGWSIKRAIRQIVLSSTYRQSSKPRADAADVRGIDPDNQWYHAAAVRRLTAESIRDATLSVAGSLDRQMYGPSIPIYLTEFMQGRGRPAKSGPLDGHGRRSIYLEVRRNFLSPMMLAFDMPIPFSAMGRRSVSNVPAQSLIMMNHPLVHQQSKQLGQLWHNDPTVPVDDRLDALYFRVLGRPLTAAERQPLLEYLRRQGVNQNGQPTLQAWTATAHALLNTKEFIFLR